MARRSLPSIPLTCRACSNQFFVYPPEAMTRQFCSVPCRNRVITTLRPLAERFWEKVTISGADECWLWQAGAANGYGKIRVHGKQTHATHVSWFFAFGVWPTLFVCHACDTPRCVNPAHLWLGTPTDNMRDMVSKRRDRSVTRPDLILRGEDAPRAKLSNKQRLELRQLHATGGWTCEQLAQHYGISSSGAWYILRKSKEHTPYPR